MFVMSCETDGSADELLVIYYGRTLDPTHIVYPPLIISSCR